MAKKPAPKKSAKTSVKATVKTTQSGIGSWNKWLALVFGVQVIMILLFSAVQSYPVTINYLGLDSLQTNAQGKTVLATGSQSIFNLNLAYVIAASLLLAAIAYALLASRLLAFYQREIKNSINSVRWILYAVSTSIMVTAVALVSGVQDIASLYVILSSTALMFVLAMFAERHDQGGRTKWVLFWLSVVSGIIPWTIIKLNIIGGTIYGSVPAFVYWISIVALVLFALVPLNLFLQLRKSGNWKNYLYADRMYVIASLVMYTVTAWLIYVAILRP
ncbi:MAG TPA: heliorhodopsin HeR [Candidatus Saccharimonadales bacterium]|nr:heliorhodopsin HeR [Candidatus Saccharimonadales bacterium]